MIVLTNDDGFYAEGLQTLRREMEKEFDVLVIAPETEQSAMGHAITLTSPLKAKEIVEDGKTIGYAVSGTPADCVKLAITELLDEPPELVISGINLGGNLGTCVIYSGTVSAATEAAIMGVPSIAVSLDTWEQPNFVPSAQFARQLAPLVLKKGLPEGVSLNVNVPNISREEIRGAVITRQGKSRVIETFDKRVDPRKNIYYWLAGEMRFNEVEEGTDTEMVSKNYISITPIHFDLTNFKAMDLLKEWDLPYNGEEK